MSESDFFNYSHIGHAIKIQPKWRSKPLRTYPSSYQPPMQVNIVTHANAAATIGVGGGYYQVQPHGSKANNKQQASSLPILPTNLPSWAKFFMKKSWIQYYLPQGNPIYFIQKSYPFVLMDHIPSSYFEGLARARIYYENEELEQMTESLSI
jgi:hypothetical protein